MDENSIYNGVIPVKDYIRKVAEAYDLTSAEAVMLLQVFTDWLALERQPFTPVTVSGLRICIQRAGDRLGRPDRAHMSWVGAELSIQDPRALLALDAVDIEDDHG